MKNLVGSLCLFFIASTGFGQKTYDDLRILYADGNYSKLAKVADKYTNDDNTKKDVLPYLWLSKGLYKIHVGGNADPVFKNAYKESINALSKAIKMDKDGSVMSEINNKEFLELLQNSIVEQIDNDISTGNYRKAFGNVTSYKKISKNLVGQVYLEGACKFRNDDKSTGFTLWKNADDQLKKITSLDEWTEADKEMLKMGAIQVAECYVSIKKVDVAKAMLNKVAQWFEEDEEFKEIYDKIVN